MFTKASTVLTAIAAPLSIWVAAQGSPEPGPAPASVDQVAPEVVALSSVEGDAVDFLGGAADQSKLSYDNAHGDLVWTVTKGEETTKFDAKTGELVEMSW